MLSRNSIMARLRSLLGRAEIEYHDLPHTINANVEWDSSGPIKIKIDKSGAGDIPCTIHELLHVVVDEFVDKYFDDELSEVVVAALEDHLVKSMSTRSLSWWRKEIHKRIK